jgi:hypothetical protein
MPPTYLDPNIQAHASHEGECQHESEGSIQSAQVITVLRVPSKIVALEPLEFRPRQSQDLSSSRIQQQQEQVTRTTAMDSGVTPLNTGAQLLG